jgi:hypothetical protein
MLDIRGTFSYEDEQSFPILLGPNKKGGMDDDDFFEYLKKSNMKLYPNAAPVKGRWVVIKCDSGPGQLNPNLLTFLQFHGFILYPGVPNTTAVTQETDQSYGPFQSAVRSNFQLIIDKCICTDAPRSLLPWIVGLVVFSGEDPKTGLIVGSAFEKGFSKAQNIGTWEKVGAVPLSRKSLSSSKARRSIGNGNDNQQALVHLIVEHNIIACNALTLEGYNGDVMKITLKSIERSNVITALHTQDRIELLSQAKAHGNIFTATGGVHLTVNDIFQGIALIQQKILREKLVKDKTLRERQEKNQNVALDILQRKGENLTMLTLAGLTALLMWHQHPKVARMLKEAKFVAWMGIKNSGKNPPSFKRWTDANEEQMLSAQSDIVKMAHMAIGHLEAVKKKELLLAALTMSQEEFEKLAAKREKLIIELPLLGNDHPNNLEAPIMLLVDSTDSNYTSDKAACDDTFENDGRVMVDEGGV